MAVTDGDTIKILGLDQVQHKIRLIGIDAPERGQPFGTASRDHLASMVAGKEVRVIHQIGPVQPPPGKGVGPARRLPYLRQNP